MTAMPTRLLAIMRLLYRMPDSDVETLIAILLEGRKEAWRTAIAKEARAFGYRGPVNDPRRGDLAYLRAESVKDAQSIQRTFNRDIERQLQKLYQANPRGNRFYYAKHLDAYIRQRDSWKTRQIARQTEYTAAGYAQRRFWEENGLRGDWFVFDGPPPVCATCVQLFSLGPVRQDVVDRNPTPVHIGCPHTWRRLGHVEAPPLDDLWVG